MSDHWFLVFDIDNFRHRDFLTKRDNRNYLGNDQSVSQTYFHTQLMIKIKCGQIMVTDRFDLFVCSVIWAPVFTSTKTTLNGCFDANREIDISRPTSTNVYMNHIDLIYIDLNSPKCDSHRTESHWQLTCDSHQTESHHIKWLSAIITIKTPSNCSCNFLFIYCCFTCSLFNVRLFIDALILT